MKKPSEIKNVTAKLASILPSSFEAITLFGVIHCQKKYNVEQINKTNEIDSILKCHETIHVRQAESTNDSWFKFYTLYAWQWICNLPLIWYGTLMPYKFIAFELEAYCNEDDYNYPNNGAAYQWKKFKKLSLKEKMELAEAYAKCKKILAFRKFVKNDILPTIK